MGIWLVDDKRIIKFIISNLYRIICHIDILKPACYRKYHTMNKSKIEYIQLKLLDITVNRIKRKKKTWIKYKKKRNIYSNE